MLKLKMFRMQRINPNSNVMLLWPFLNVRLFPRARAIIIIHSFIGLRRANDE